MPEQFKLTVYIGGSHGDLPDRLIATTEWVTTSELTIYWESGLDGVPLSQSGVKVEAVTDRPRVIPTLYLIEDWLNDSDLDGTAVEIEPTFLRKIERGS